jgi:hypothetical protein
LIASKYRNLDQNNSAAAAALAFGHDDQGPGGDYFEIQILRGAGVV